MPDVEDRLWTLTAIWAFLPIGSDVCLPLRTVCEHEVLLGILANWFWYLTAVEDSLWPPNVILVLCQLVLTFNYHWGPFVLGLGLRTRHPQKGFMTDLSFGVWVCIPFVWLVLLLSYVEWEIQVQFNKKKFSCEFMTKKRKMIFSFLDNVWLQYSLDSGENWLKWNSWNSKNPFFLHTQLGKANLIKHFFQTLGKQKYAWE